MRLGHAGLMLPMGRAPVGSSHPAAREEIAVPKGHKFSKIRSWQEPRGRTLARHPLQMPLPSALKLKH